MEILDGKSRFNHHIGNRVKNFIIYGIEKKVTEAIVLKNELFVDLYEDVNKY